MRHATRFLAQAIEEMSADYVIVGGGSAGCVLANRLSAQPGVAVILVEAGTGTKGIYASMPAGIPKLMKDPRRNWMYATEPDASIGGRRMIWHAGRMLGGGSSINGMVYIRGARSDFDDWAATGCTGWSWDELWPLFLRSESFEGPQSPFHGTDGPLSVAASRNRHPLTETFMQACSELGVRRIENYCGGDIDGVFQNYVTQRRGRRSSTERAYLRPIRDRPNLRIITDASADTLLVEGRVVKGVDCIRNGRKLRIRASKEVILSAGTIQSPAILMRSGIGSAEELKELGIPVVIDAPQVGANLQEHASFATSRFVNVPTFNTMARARRMPWILARYFLSGTGLLTTSPVLAMANVRSDPRQERPDIKLSFSPNCHDPETLQLSGRPGMTIFANVSPPKSRGRIRLRTRDASDKPVIDHQLLRHPDDMRAMIAGAKWVDRIYRSPALSRFVTGMNVPRTLPADDDEWAETIKARVGIGFHPVGTCRMGNDEASVVDPALRVRGVQGLRVADASIMPVMPMANTNAPTILIGEKAADLISEG